MKFRRKQNRLGSEDEKLPLTLLAEDGAPMLEIRPEVVDTLRRTISRLMLKESFPARLSLVAALRQEGVTYLSRALAAILANDLNESVCVLELNWWWPDKTLPLYPGNKGLSAVLAGEIILDEAIVHTGQPNLAILPAGRMSLADRPILSRSARLKGIIDELSEQFDHLILDIPAVLTTNDAIPLASLGDACCLVVNQGVTSIENVRRALDDIDHLNIIGVILNKVHISSPAWILKLIPQDSVLETGSPSA